MRDDDHRRRGSLLEVSEPNTSIPPPGSARRARAVRGKRPAGSGRGIIVMAVALTVLSAAGGIFFIAQQAGTADDLSVESALSAPSASGEFLATNGARSDVETTSSGLQYQILGAGDEAGSPGPTDYVLINYTGRIAGGETFDSGESVPMPLDGVVPGFSEGIQLMSKGARYRFWLPPALGYGESPPPGSPITAETVMEFDVDLIDFITRAQYQALRSQAQD
ncbi:FKBP-type peptidyl-prolyl cis-trans isomerase [Parasphingopyxis marina]|uniref:Peptidyl-prolyl cis-trans isomerase n=1 Tax=Parasphingopyxis marina TaxID=2761622 RepID=A0A842HY23_9SPHN|nr:FKBP-type peptidyl-prolyl cis-trans isomerase [Parasphingopyxis marina]MBC2779088.1 FKBP-type peptidyl-prolyl cis-trans isomerase [Parasphingopyxis marina]